MATVAKLSNEYLYQREQGLINLINDDLVVILMDETFVFDQTIHKVLADVQSYELPTGNGYTRQTKLLENKVLNRDLVLNKVWLTADDPIWTASGGDIGPTKAAVIIDPSSLNTPIIGCVEFAAPYTIPDTASFQLRDIQIVSTGIVNS